MAKYIAFSLGLAALSAAACVSYDATDGPTDEYADDELAIRNGVGVAPTLDAAVLIWSPTTIGSGTILSPYWVLTAAHVVDNFDAPHAITVEWGNSGTINSQTRQADAVYHHPSAVKDQGSSASKPNVVDVALIRLKEPFDAPITRSISTAPPSSYLNGLLYCLGYGPVDENDITTYGNLRSALLPVTNVGTNYLRVAEAQTIFGPQMLLGGDSGGPCMDPVSGAIVGVTSNGDGSPPASFAYLAASSAFASWAATTMSSCNGNPGAVNFCSTTCPCTYGGSNCGSNDARCGPGLVCDENVGSAFGEFGTWDVCLPDACTSRIQGSTTYCDETCPCGHGGSDCESGQCMAGTTCVSDVGAGFNLPPGHDVCMNTMCPSKNLGTNSFCQDECQCGYGGGDCDSNAQCLPGHVCATDYGPAFDMSGVTDVCVKTGCANREVYDAGFCTDDCPCGHGGGDCDDNADCMPGLHCEFNVGDQFGLPATWDICMRN